MKSLYKQVFILLIFPLLFALFLSPSLNAGQNNAKISPGVKEELKANEEGKVPVIVHLKGEADLDYVPENEQISPDHNHKQKVVNALRETSRASENKIIKSLRKEIKNGNIEDYKRFWIINAFSARINKEGLSVLSQHNEVSQIRLNQKRYIPQMSSREELKSELGSKALAALPMRELSSSNDIVSRSERKNNAADKIPWNQDAIKAPSAWNKGIYGEDVVVAIIDTGVDPDHPLLKDSYRGNSPGHNHKTSWYDLSSNTTRPYDPNGHGTHMAGTILGGSPEEPFGTAPAAQWIAVNIFQNGFTWDSTIVEAFQWVMAPGGDPENAPDIINSSWASKPGHFEKDLLWELTQNVQKAGIFVIFAAGNNAHMGPGPPASFPHTFSVGSLNEQADAAYFSSRGPSTLKEIDFIKPEILAPGTNIRSAWPGDSYTVLEGTSTSSAHVSGAAALILQNNENLNPSEVSYILKQSSQWEYAWNANGTRPNNTYGYGLLDVHGALQKSGEKPQREILYSDSGENGLKNWLTSYQEPWELNQDRVYEGEYSFAAKNSNNTVEQDSWLVLRDPLKHCGYDNHTLTFQHHYQLPQRSTAHIEISSDGSNWLDLYTFNGSTHDFDNFSISLPSSIENEKLYLRFRVKGRGADYKWFIDNINITAFNKPLSSLGKLDIALDSTELLVEEEVEIKSEAFFCQDYSRNIDPSLIRWSSSNPFVAKVDEEKGKIKGVSEGEAVIVANFANQRQELHLEVKEPQKKAEN